MAVPAGSLRNLSTHPELIDPFNGMRDLQGRVIRSVGEARERFAEDPLRLLRAVRFAAQLGFHIEETTEAAIRDSANALGTISAERIANEFTKILVSPHPAHGTRVAVDLGLMPYIVPELLVMLRMQSGRGHKDVFTHTLLVVEQIPAETLLRWTALLHDIAKPRTIGYEGGEVHFWGHERVGESMSREILKRLKLDGHLIETVGKLVRMHVRANSYEDDWTDSALRRLIREAGDDFGALLHLCRADVTSSRSARVEAAQARADRLEARVTELLAREDVAKLDSPLDGNELMAMFSRPPGRWIADVKGYLLDLVLEGELAPDDKDAAAALARQFVAAKEASA
jgi:poly(A) polymerase